MAARDEQQAQPPLHIEIARVEEGSWSVRSGVRYEECLAPEEALWCVIRLMTGTGYGFLRTAEQHAEWDAKYGPKKPLESWQRQLAPSDLRTEAAPGSRAKTETQP